MRRRGLLMLFGLLAATFGRGTSPITAADRKGKGGGPKMTAWDFDFESIDGGPLPMKAYRGKAVLVVNTASFCGFTPQYTDLEKLWTSYKDKGLVVLGVPSNDFGAQEPGTAAEIKQFCETYDVSFPLSRKEQVIGGQAHPFYRWVVSELGEGAAPKWNFHKYLVDPKGELVGMWPSRVKPMSKDITGAVEAALKP